MKTTLPSIAILENDVFYAKFLNHGLKKMHYPFVVNYYNELDLLNNIKKTKPDILLLDHYLDNTIGLEVMDKVKELELNTKIVYVSDQQDPAVEIKALEKGAVKYLKKDNLVLDNLKKVLLKVRKEKMMNESKSSMIAKAISFGIVVILMTALITYLMLK